MDRFFAANLNTNSDSFVLDEADEVHHLVDVFRLKTGDMAEFVNGRGILARGRISSTGKRSVQVIIESKQSQPESAGPRLILACALVKRSAFEDVVDQATQLGVDEIIPLITERTEVRGVEADDSKRKRYEKISIVALKQSKRLWLPRVHAPCVFKQSFDRLPANAALGIPWLEGDRLELLDFARKAVTNPAVVIFIGPEGDFSPREVQFAMTKGAVPVSLGPHVLRVSTAAAAAMAVISSISRKEN